MLTEKYFFCNDHEADLDSYPDLSTKNYEIAALFCAISYKKACKEEGKSICMAVVRAPEKDNIHISCRIFVRFQGVITGA